MPDNRIRLLPNEPVTVALVDPFGDSSEGYDFALQLCEYRTTDGRTLVLPRDAAIRLNGLDPKPGESITLCRAKQGHHISVCLTPASEKERAAEEAQDVPSNEEFLLEASLKREAAKQRRNGHPVPIRKEPAPAVEAQPRLGTGTDGPAPQLAPAAIAQPRPAPARVVIHYGDALRHIIHTVEAALKAEKVQLGDEPRQGLYSTVYIDFAKRCRVEYDFTRGAE